MFPYGHKNTIILWHILADASNPFMHVRYDRKCEYVTFKNYLSFDVLAYCLWSRTIIESHLIVLASIGSCNGLVQSPFFTQWVMNTPKEWRKCFGFWMFLLWFGFGEYNIGISLLVFTILLWQSFEWSGACDANQSNMAQFRTWIRQVMT